MSRSVSDQRRKLSVVSDNKLIEGMEGVNIDENGEVRSMYSLLLIIIIVVTDPVSSELQSNSYSYIIIQLFQ